MCMPLSQIWESRPCKASSALRACRSMSSATSGAVHTPPATGWGIDSKFTNQLAWTNTLPTSNIDCGTASFRLKDQPSRMLRWSSHRSAAAVPLDWCLGKSLDDFCLLIILATPSLWSSTKLHQVKLTREEWVQRVLHDFFLLCLQPDMLNGTAPAF